MKDLAQTLWITFLLLFRLLPATAQDVGTTPAPKSKPRESVRIYQQYDKSKEETITSIRPIPPAGHTFVSVGPGLDINVYYTYPGKTPAPPKSIIISIIDSSPELQYENNRELTVKADGQTYRLGRMDYRQVPEFSFGGFIGKLLLSIPVETFNRIAGAKKVHLKLGSFDYDLEEHDLRKWRALASTTTP